MSKEVDEEGYQFNNTEEEDHIEEEEAIIIFSDSIETPSLDPKLVEYRNGLSKFKNFVSDIDINEYDDHLNFYIPSILLPVTLRYAYGFENSEILLQIQMYLNDYDWTQPPISCEITNPLTRNYSGKALVIQAKEDFFKHLLDKKTNFRSAPLILRAQKDADSGIVRQIERLGFTHMQAVRAASLCNNNLEQSVTFLQTGEYQRHESFEILLSKKECPLLYFVLNILDAILDLQDHCTICGSPTTAGLKPGVCTKDECLHSFVALGVGNSLCKEIARDPFVADLLFTVFSNTYQTEFFNPKPQIELKKSLDEIIRRMPSMKEIARCESDTYLLQKIGRDSVDLLRWIIFTCRSNFLLLPPELEFSQFRSSKMDQKCYQFMAITATPEQENIFQQLKKKYGSKFLWHGSHIDRWHAIIRQGLKNLSYTRFMSCGACYGEGIYFAPNSSTSLQYTNIEENAYLNSALGKKISIIALCEVIQFPYSKDMNEVVEVTDPKTGKIVRKTLQGRLNDNGWNLTLTMNEACIVRFLLVNLDQHVDVCANPPKNIPTLNQVLKLRAHLGK